MTPGTLILLGAPLPGTLADALKTHGHHVIVPCPSDPPAIGHRYVAACALAITAAAPEPPLVLLAHAETGPLLPSLALAQRAAKRQLGAYVLLDADLPSPTDDWPDAPCVYVSTHPGDPRIRTATLRAWPVTETSSNDLPDTLQTLIAAL